jgi:hypothetical protein
LVLVVLEPLVVLLAAELVAITPFSQLLHLLAVGLVVLDQPMVLPVVQAVVVLALAAAGHLAALVIHQALAHRKVLRAVMVEVLHTMAAVAAAQVLLVLMEDQT